MSALISYLIIAIIVFSIPPIVVRFGKQFLVALMPIYLIVANVFAESFFNVSGIIQSLAVPIYCATFLVTNILTELYGKYEAKRAIWVGFIGQIVFVLVMLIITNTEILPENLKKYQDTFKFLPRLVLGSMVAYIVSQLSDVFTFYLIKKKTGGKKLFIRNTLSTSISQLIDTTVLVYIAFWGSQPFDSHSKIWSFILSTWIFKIFVAIFDYPFMYLSTKSKTK